MTRRVITTAVTATWPPTRTDAYPVQVTWPKSAVIEITAGSALETAVGLANTRIATDGDVTTPKDGATSN